MDGGAAMYYVCMREVRGTDRRILSAYESKFRLLMMMGNSSKSVSLSCCFFVCCSVCPVSLQTSFIASARADGFRSQLIVVVSQIKYLEIALKCKHNPAHHKVQSTDDPPSLSSPFSFFRLRAAHVLRASPFWST